MFVVIWDLITVVFQQKYWADFASGCATTGPNVNLVLILRVADDFLVSDEANPWTYFSF
jgi:hypothetical protein